ncbi:hypothetical protein RJ639_020264, partial [Escallonia herrerae]
MELVCPIDAQFRDQIDALLKPPSPGHVQAKLSLSLQIYVHIFSTPTHYKTNLLTSLLSAFQEYFDQLIESSQCRGLKIKTNGEHGKGVYADLDFKEGELVLKDQMLVGAQHTMNKTFSHTSKDCNEFDSSSDLYCQSLAECASSSSNTKSPLDQEVVESLVNEKLVLPYSKCFPLPSVVSCPGGCKEASYCWSWKSISCAEADWNSSHSLLCTGERSKSVCKEALHKFIQHANETNDIFLLAAKVISSTILRYRKLKVACQQEQGKQVTPDVLGNCNLSLLLEAWKPVSMGHKRRWWDCIALPDGVHCCDEVSFRMQIRQLAFEDLVTKQTIGKGHKGYRCYSPDLHRYLVSTDVVFFEHSPFFSSKSDSSSKGEDDDWLMYEIFPSVSTEPALSEDRTLEDGLSVPVFVPVKPSNAINGAISGVAQSEDEDCLGELAIVALALVKPPIVQVYSRRREHHDTCPEPASSSSDPPPTDLDLPIGLRK